MPGKVNVTFADFGGEKSTASFFIQDPTAINFDANNTLVSNLLSAVVALTEGLLVKDQRIYEENGTGVGEASNPTAQRELKWLITYSDDVTGKRYQRELPCPLLTAGATGTLLAGIAGQYNPAAPEWIAFETDFEAIVVSELGNTVSFESARLVGRNN